MLDAGDASIAVAAEERLARFAKPTVAAIRGACVGGGAQLAVACDLRIDDRAEPARIAWWHRKVTTTGEAREGVAAITERRQPRFAWRPPTGG